MCAEASLNAYEAVGCGCGPDGCCDSRPAGGP